MTPRSIWGDGSTELDEALKQIIKHFKGKKAGFRNDPALFICPTTVFLLL